MALASPKGELHGDLDVCSIDRIPDAPHMSELSALTSPESTGFGRAEDMQALSFKSPAGLGSDGSFSETHDFDNLKVANYSERPESFEDGAFNEELITADSHEPRDTTETCSNLAQALGTCMSLDERTSFHAETFSKLEENSIMKGTPPWYHMFRQRLADPQVLKLHRGPVNSLLISAENASEVLTMYSAGKDGFIKVYSISEGFQVRATKLGNLPLAALALAASSDAYPTVLAGSYDDCVYAYSVDYGRALGKIRVHDDTVSCVKVAGTSNLRMITGSWDATVKVWSIEEGRGGWASSFCTVSGSTERVPECDILEHEVAVWSLDISENGYLTVSGSEDGIVKAWDLRASSSLVWQYSTGTSAIAGLRLTEDASNVVAACRDGNLRLLEMRRNGAELTTKDCGSPLKCCDIAGPLAIAGCEDGTLHFWPFQDTSSTSGPDIANKFLDFSPIRDHAEAVNCISINKGNHGSDATLASASEDCTIQVYRTGKT